MARNPGLFVVVGGSQSHVPFIEAARNLGYRTVVFDRNPLSPGASAADVFCPISTHDAAGILAECHSLSKQAPLAGIITYSAYTMPLKAVAQVGTAFGLCSFPLEAVENTTNKARMKQRLCEAHVPTPKWLVATSWSEVVSSLLSFQPPIVVKPASGSVGSTGISIATDEEQLRIAFEAASQASDDGAVILEKFHDAPEFSVDGIISGDTGTVLAVSDKFNLGAERNFIMSGFATGRTSQAELKDSADAITEVVLKAVEALAIKNFFFSADVLLTDEGPLVLEVGLLLDAKIDRLLHFCGINVYELICRVACGLDIRHNDRSWARGYALKFMFADRSGLLSAGPGIEPETLGNTEERWMIEWERQNGDFVQLPESIADAIGWVIAEGKDRVRAYELASRKASEYPFVVTAKERHNGSGKSG